MTQPITLATSARAERISDGVVHVVGLGLVAVAVPVLIGLTIWRQGPGVALFGTAIYATTLTAMIGFSALYNTVGQRRWSGLLRRLDHAAIYAKIAGTYTPFALMSGNPAPWLLIGLWTAALAGIGIKVVSPARFRGLALALYLGMGWAGVLAGGALFATLSPPVLVMIATGGTIYTLGVAFYLFERVPFHTTLWHVAVLAATIIFYGAVTVQVVQGPA